MNFLTEIKEGLAIAWDAIRANKLRSVLTTLGIIIGIVTVTLMGTVIDGLHRAFMNSMAMLGADTLYVSRAGWFVESPEWPGPKSKKAKIVAFTDNMPLDEYTELCVEINKIYLTGKQSDEPAKDPN